MKPINTVLESPLVEILLGDMVGSELPEPEMAEGALV
jgi:hypothetical protein